MGQTQDWDDHQVMPGADCQRPLFTVALPACRTDRYMEVDVDVASSSAANTVVKLVQGATRHLVVDMAILLEVRLLIAWQTCAYMSDHLSGYGTADCVPDLLAHAWPISEP